MKKHFTSQDARNLINVYDFAIFPIHGIKDGICTCNKQDCASPGKHPATPDGFKSASKDIERVKKLWAGRQGLNVGIATGEASGVFVVDIDSPQAEIEINKLIDFPQTYAVKTGRGKHLYFKYDPNRPIKNGTRIIQGVDIRGDGGYVAGAGSVHQNGQVYEAINPLENFAQAPQALYDLLEKEKPLYQPQSSKLFTDGWSTNDIAQHLSYIDPDTDYDTWIKIGMALHEEGVNFSLWDEWSKRGSKYDGSTNFHWKSFNKGGGVTYGTVVALAKRGGWVPKKAVTPTALPQKITDVNEEIDSDASDVKENHFYYINGPDIKFEPTSNDFVQGLLSESALSVVYGESNCGKTFFMTDLAFHITQGKRWRDRRVNKGAVLYLCLEGAYGIKGRIRAYKQENDTDLDGFLLMPCAVNFMNPEVDVPQLRALIERAKQEYGDIKMVIVDTLARALSGADENSGQDMGALVANADYIRNSTGAHVCFIHHSGKDRALGARGHSSLRAAVDTEIEIHRGELDDYSTVKIVKQREMEPLEDMAFSLKSVTIGTNQYMEEIKSCVVKEVEAKAKNATVKMNDVQAFLYKCLQIAIKDHAIGKQVYGKDGPFVQCVSYDQLREVMEEHGFKEVMETANKTTSQQIKSATQSARLYLQRNNKISFDGSYIWLMDDSNY